MYVALQGSSLDSLSRSTKLVSGWGLRGCGPSTLRRRGGLGSRGGCGGRLGGLLLLCLELVEPFGDELDVRRVVESRVEDVPVHTGKYGGNMSPAVSVHPENALGSYLTVPLLSIKNVTRAVSASPKRPFPTWYAFRASPFGSLRIGYYNSSRGVPSDNQEAMETIGCMARTVSFCFSTNSFCLSAASPLAPTISTFVRLKRSFSARVSPSPPVSCPTTVHGEGGEAAYLRAHRGTGMPPSCSRTSLRACMRGQYERVHCPRIRRLRGQR